MRRSRGFALCLPLSVLLAATVLETACEGSTKGTPGGALKQPIGKSAQTPQPPATTATPNGAAPETSSGYSWDASAGPALLIAGSNSSEAGVVLPQYTDSTLADAPLTVPSITEGTHVDLFGRSGRATNATLQPGAAGSYSGGCTSWPSAQVVTPSGPPPAWMVGFVAGHAAGLSMDSVDMLSARDSSRRAAEVIRAASGLPDDTAADFHGVPITMRDAHRFVIPPVGAGKDSTEVIAAELVRRLNTEANPREEQVILVLERTTPTMLTPAYWDRVSGAEDEVETSEVQASVLMGPARTPALIVSRDDGDGGSYTLLQRDGPHHWKVRWNSAYTGC